MATLLASAVCAAVVTVTVAGLVTPTPSPAVAQKVLVVTDGTPGVEAIRQELASERIPTALVNLAESGRPVITAGFLSDTLAGKPRAKFSGVVLPDDAPAGLTAGEQDALARFESYFRVRQVDSFGHIGTAVGLSTPSYGGTLDGQTAQLSASARNAGFSYLTGPVRFDGTDPAVAIGYLASPLPDDPATGAHFESYLTASAPGGSADGTVAGVYSVRGREQLVLGFAYDYGQQQFQLLAPGIISWLTRGIRPGTSSNDPTVHDVAGSDTASALAVTTTTTAAPTTTISAAPTTTAPTTTDTTAPGTTDTMTPGTTDTTAPNNQSPSSSCRHSGQPTNVADQQPTGSDPGQSGPGQTSTPPTGSPPSTSPPDGKPPTCGPDGTAGVLPITPPTCTVNATSAAQANSAKAGDTVCFSGIGLAGSPLNITVSGTATAPIIITGDGNTAVKGITVNASNVVVQGFNVLNATAPGVGLQGNNITLQDTNIDHPTGGDFDGIRFFGDGIKILHNHVINITNTGGAHADCMQTFATTTPTSHSVLISGNRCEKIDNQCLIAQGPHSTAGNGSGQGNSSGFTFTNNYCDAHASQAVQVDDVQNFTATSNDIEGAVQKAFNFINKSTGAKVGCNTLGPGVGTETIIDSSSRSGSILS
ncbi:MAG TPA: right-handed parallel beta-helix repeat-containing protein [Pseudonocardiaceae bacterium]